MKDHFQSARRALAANVERRWREINALMQEQAGDLARIQQLDLLTGAGPLSGASAPNTVDVGSKAPQAPLPARREPSGRAARLILESLRATPAGVHGRELNERVIAAGLSRDAAEKAKMRLRADGWTTYEPSTKIWAMAEPPE